MSVNGVIALIVQAVIFPLLADWIGVWQVFVVCTIGHPLAYFVVPYMALLPEAWLFSGIYTCLVIRNLFYVMAYPVLLILIKQASPSVSVLGKINGLAASVGAAARTVAPPVSGYLYGVGSQNGMSGLPWWATAFVAMLGVVQLWFVDRKNDGSVTVKALAPCVASMQHQQQRDEVVHIVVNEQEQEQEQV